jgi:hypothetical protein
VSRSLQVGNIIVEPNDVYEGHKGNHKGIRLPDGFVPSKASILDHTICRGKEEQAVLLLVGKRSRETYQTLIQLQVQASKDNHKVDNIISGVVCEGQISSVCLSTCHIFLAGCAFQNLLNIEKGQ